MVGGLHDKVLEVLGLEIADGTHPPGSVLRIDEMEARFGISRSVAREVVRTLASISLVVGRKRVGIVVRPREEWNSFDPTLIRWRLTADRAASLKTLAELRTAVEPVAAGAAARRCDDDAAGRLVSLSERLVATSRAGDLDAFMDADVEFHRLILTTSGNEMFAQLHEVVEELLRWRAGHGLMPVHPRPVAVRLHCEIAECVRSGDRVRAEGAMRELVAEAFEGTLAGLEEHPEAPG